MEYNVVSFILKILVTMLILFPFAVTFHEINNREDKLNCDIINKNIINYPTTLLSDIPIHLTDCKYYKAYIKSKGVYEGLIYVCPNEIYNQLK